MVSPSAVAHGTLLKPPRWDAIILSGGKSRRLGSDKDKLIGPDGRSTVERTVDACADAIRRVIVGPPHEITSAVSVTWAREEPPFSGPARAIAAGLAALDRHTSCEGEDDDEWVATVACDMPNVASAVEALLATATRIEADHSMAKSVARRWPTGPTNHTADVDGVTSARDMAPAKRTAPTSSVAPAEATLPIEGVVPVDESGRRQWLCALYRRSALRRAVAQLNPAGSGESVRALVDALTMMDQAVPSGSTADIDTIEQARELGFAPPIHPYNRSLDRRDRRRRDGRPGHC
jgi:molybdopterin-guanine dinucleotide biosynthesis protein A